MTPVWLLSLRKEASAPRKGSAGFTLPEILIAITIATFVLAGATSMFITFVRTNMTMAARSEYDRQMRTAIQQIADDSREAANARVTGSTQISLTMNQGETPQVVHYTYDSQAQQLLRSEDAGADAVLLRDCSSFGVSESDGRIFYTVEFSKKIGGQVIDLQRELNLSMRN